MCLEYIGDFKIKTNIGYKVFIEKGNNGKLYGDYRNRGDIRPINRWLNEYDFRDHKWVAVIKTCNDRSYNVGWHIFLTKKDAKQWASGSNKPGKVKCSIRKVKFKDIVAIGYQRTCGFDSFKVVVAKQMLILPEKKGIKK